MTDTPRRQRNWLYLLFAVSGFSGLIYESIWSHYLKLFLGHAAYAQTLVLAIFMGGMAIGAWIPSRYGVRWKNLLLGYALVEAVIGVCAILFHKIFIGATDVAYDSLIPALSSPWAVNILKWGLATILILPQSVLLGMTFPLMSASLIRRHPNDPGTSLAMLYFTNSLGAAIGVLVSGFILVDAVGLPGTILTAGLINFAVALIAWHFSKNVDEPAPARNMKRSSDGKEAVSWHLLITASFVTGAASFIYEIGWIRMLSLVLGTSTHAFELMLSAFIAGLAFGGLWIRSRIDNLAHPMKFLGWIQVLMGVLALMTLIAYNASFDMMQLLLRSVTGTDGGYLLFNVASQGIAIIVMVPVTFCAGMTLPLITHNLLRGGHGEKSIGAVYSANTLGAIFGVFLAVHVGLPTLGLKGLITAGAVLDMALGVVLLGVAAKSKHWRPAWAASLLAIIVLVGVLGGVDLDRYKMASGVYRYGHLYAPNKTEILFHKDGKTATVDLIKTPDGGISIATNGKTDAKIMMADENPAHSDESTMTLIGSIPLLLRPHAHTAAVIGMGSGLTTHVLLASKNLTRVDTIEIEPAMIEAANGFRPRVEAPFTDPRSYFHIDDAKTYFSANRSRYDLIVSEPSNPWVSGVSGLFTDEFYRRARTHLNSDGIFAQWMHVYEMDFNLVASVLKAIDANFSDYSLYAANDGDLLILAVTEGKVPRTDTANMSHTNLTAALRLIDIRTVKDIDLRYIGDRALLEPLFTHAPVPVNSDFFPILDLHAVRARFLKSNATELTTLRADELPAVEMLSGQKAPTPNIRLTPSSHFMLSRRAHTAAVIRDFYINGRLRADDTLEPNLQRHAELTLRLANNCSGTQTSALWLESVYEVMKILIPSIAPAETDTLWRRFRASDCYARLHPVQKDVFALLGAVGRRDARLMATLSEKLLRGGEMPKERDSYLLAAGMLGYLAGNQPEKAQQLWKSYAPRALGTASPSLLLRLLWAHSVDRAREREKQKS